MKEARILALYEWIVAFRYLRMKRNKGERNEGFISLIAILSFLGIMVGVATLIIVLAVMNGFRQELLGRIVGVNGHVVVHPVEGNLKNFEPILQRIRLMKGLRQAIPIVEGQVLASGPKRAQGAFVRGIRGEDLKGLTLLSQSIQGTLSPLDSPQDAVLGARLARRLGVKLGDRFTLLTPRGANTPFGVTPRARSYRVDGVFQIGMSEIDSNLIFLPLEEAQSFLNSEGEAHAIEISLDDPQKASEFRKILAKRLGEGSPPFRIRDWTQIHATLAGALQVERNVMFLILTLIILVAALNVVSSMIMLVKENRGEIAILRAMGATRGAILRIFFITGAAIGVFGTLSGLILGVSFAGNIEAIRQTLSNLFGVNLFPPEVYFLSQLPAEINFSEVALVSFIALLLSFLATLYPAFRAASMDVVESLRHE